MSMLLLQTFLLMLTAFFLGALVACLVKSTFAATTSEPRADAVTAPAPAAQPRMPAMMAPQAAPRAAPDAISPRIETVVRPATAPSMPVPDAQRFERALRQQTGAAAEVRKPPVSPPAPTTGAPTPGSAMSQPVPPAGPRPMPPAAVVPRVEIKPAEPLRAPAPTSAAAPSSAAMPATGPRIDSGAAAAVAAAAAMAASQPRVVDAPPKPTPSMPSPAVAPPAPEPSAPRTIMPAAAGSGGPASVAAEVSMKSGAAPTVAAAAVAEDDLTRIRAIDTVLQGQLNRLGVRRFEDIARWASADVKRIGEALGAGRRIASENWIEQAQILAKGAETDYSRRRTAAAAAGLPLAAPSRDEGVPAPQRASAQPAAMLAAPEATPSPAFELPRTGAQAAAAAAAAIAAAAAASVRRGPAPAAEAAPTAGARDSLQRINGIDADTERLLNSQGVTRFAQIAGWSASDTERFGDIIGMPGRISRENWIEQAAILAGSGTTAYARRTDTPPRAEADSPRPTRLADAIREREEAAKASEPARSATAAARPDLSNLRSVRSEALRGDTSAGAAIDDLKRIRGIGVLIEKKLNSLGISTYEQVANWTGADIDRVSQILDFKGRIERESWVEQARILATGGQTEFSRRVDKDDA